MERAPTRNLGHAGASGRVACHHLRDPSGRRPTQRVGQGSQSLQSATSPRPSFPAPSVQHVALPGHIPGNSGTTVCLEARAHRHSQHGHATCLLRVRLPASEPTLPMPLQPSPSLHALVGLPPATGSVDSVPALASKCTSAVSVAPPAGSHTRAPRSQLRASQRPLAARVRHGLARCPGRPKVPRAPTRSAFGLAQSAHGGAALLPPCMASSPR